MGGKTTSKDIYELTRFATNSLYLIVGGFSKILSFSLKNYKIEEIFTYADLRWSDVKDNVYSKNKFNYEHTTKPNYWYVKGKKDIIGFLLENLVLKQNFPKYTMKRKLKQKCY